MVRVRVGGLIGVTAWAIVAGDLAARLLAGACALIAPARLLHVVGIGGRALGRRRFTALLSRLTRRRRGRVDPFRVRQAVANLIDNALRHGRSRVFVRAEREGSQLMVAVEDAGPGFPPAFVDRAFERFSRADPSRGRGGAGLGLAIVRAIARAHGGEASIESGDLGSMVVLRLPLAEQAARSRSSS